MSTDVPASDGDCDGEYSPIVIGYAFGPKKMSTMGMVLAEASRTKVWRPTTLSEMVVEETAAAGGAAAASDSVDEGVTTRKTPPSDDKIETSSAVSNMAGLTQAALHSFTEKRQDRQDDGEVAFHRTNDSYRDHFQTTTAAHGLATVIRKFRSTCSSTGGTITTDTGTAPSIMSVRSQQQQLHQDQDQQQTMNHQLIRLSFVPLDIDVPIHEQHGGRFDLILHKLTEDILASEDSRNSISRSRIDRLVQYCQVDHPACCLLDDPFRVRRLLSRDVLCRALHQNLQNVSGANAPRYVVVDLDESSCRENVRDRLRQAGLTSFPLLAKPCVAAGAKSSHHMSLLVRPRGLSVFLKRRKETSTSSSTKYILQEYRNHDAKLYKVYVLGDEDVRVFERPSLPNLNMVDMDEDDIDDGNESDDDVCVDFDSQRPYPDLRHLSSLPASSSSSTTFPPVSVHDVRPISVALQQAFGLHLFGFDVLRENGAYWIVDVNYFPSYKEVPDFPRLLARYLTNRVLERRREQRHVK